MQKNNEINTKERNNNDKIDRRKRVNRIKTAIVFIVILLLLIPTVSCIILGFQVSRLQRQVDQLAAMHGEYGMIKENNGDNFALAAENLSEDTDKPEERYGLGYFGYLSSGIPKLNPTFDVTAEDQQKETDNKPKADVKASDSKNNNQASGTEKEKGIYAGKKVYLTFDDGPSVYTDEILDILAEYNVKATFFVIGKTDKASKDLYKRIVEEGHILGMHSYSHSYEKIYNSLEDFDKDFTKLWKLLYDTTGYKPSIYRFPGGSENQVNRNGMDEFIQYLNDASIVYYDWNVENGDATGKEYTKKQLVDNVLNGVAVKSTSIVLMHDSKTKKTTVDSLPELLDALITGGADILPLDKDVPPIQMIEADSIN